MSAGSKRRALASYFFMRLCHVVIISKHRGDWDLRPLHFWFAFVQRTAAQTEFWFVLRAKHVFFFGSRHCTAVLVTQVPKTCTDLDLRLHYIFILAPYSNPPCLSLVHMTQCFQKSITKNIFAIFCQKLPQSQPCHLAMSTRWAYQAGIWVGRLTEKASTGRPLISELQFRERADTGQLVANALVQFCRPATGRFWNVFFAWYTQCAKQDPQSVERVLRVKGYF